MEPIGYYRDISVHGDAFKIGCPQGYGLGLLKVDNNTMVLGCHVAFSESAENYFQNTNKSANIILGSILGPFGLIVLVAAISTSRWYRNQQIKKAGITSVATKEQYKAIVPVVQETRTAKERVTALLSAGGLHDFEFGYLSSALKNELMALRLREGRDLTECIEYAKQLNCPLLAAYVEGLNPGMIPANIRNVPYTRDAYPMPTAPPV